MLASPLNLEAKAWIHALEACLQDDRTEEVEQPRNEAWLDKGLRTGSGNGLGLIEKSVPGRVVVQRARPAASCLLVTASALLLTVLTTVGKGKHLLLTLQSC